MRKLLFAVAVAVSLAMVSPAWAIPTIQERDDAIRDYKKGEYATAFATLLELARLEEIKDYESQFYVGRMYYEGLGTAKDPAQGLQFLESSAYYKYVPAQAYLGDIYAEGGAVKKDYKKSYLRRKAAAEAGNVDAQYGLATMYFAGQGVPQDYVQTHKWANLAISRGDPEEDAAIIAKATKLRDDVSKLMSADQVANAQKEATEWAPVTEDQPALPPKNPKATTGNNGADSSDDLNADKQNTPQPAPAPKPSKKPAQKKAAAPPPAKRVYVPVYVPTYTPTPKPSSSSSSSNCKYFSAKKCGN